MASKKTSLKSGILKQVIFTFIVAAAKLEVGLVIGWPTVMPKIQSDNSTSLVVTEDDVTWFVSMPGIAGIALALVCGTLMEALGPRRMLVVSLPPAAIAFLLQAFTPYLSLFYLGRIVTCVTLTVLGPVASVLITELCQPRIRGLLLSIEEVTVAMGQMLVYVMAQFLPWDVATALCAAPVFLFGFLSFLVPESPYWLVRHDKADAAKKSLEKLRDPKDDIELELLEVTKSIQEQPQTTIKKQIKQFAQPQNYRPVLLLSAVLILRELGGQHVIFSYAVYLFQKAGVSLDAFTCTVLVGAVRLFFTFVAAAVVDRVGRRPLLIATTLVCGLAEVVGAIFLQMDLPGSSWMPLVSILLYVSSYGLGLGPIPWILIGELIPTPVRSYGSSLCILNFSVFTFVVSFLFPHLLEFGLGVALLVFASAHALLMLLLCLFMPETRGRSLQDLQEAFKSQSPHG